MFYSLIDELQKIKPKLPCIRFNVMSRQFPASICVCKMHT